MPIGNVNYQGPAQVGANPGNIMAEVARRWLQQRQAVTAPVPDGADAAMAQMLGLAGAPPPSLGIEQPQPAPMQPPAQVTQPPMQGVQQGYGRMPVPVRKPMAMMGR